MDKRASKEMKEKILSDNDWKKERNGDPFGRSRSYSTLMYYRGH